jgi:hypothetical protein
VNAEEPIGVTVDKSTLLQPRSISTITVLSPEIGKTYSGHITLSTSTLDGLDTVLHVYCGVPTGKLAEVGESAVSLGTLVNDDFTCLSLQIDQVNNSTSQNETSTAIGVIQYQSTTNTSTIQ